MGWRVNKIFRKPGAPGVRCRGCRGCLPQVVVGNRQAPGGRAGVRGLGTGRTPIDSAGLKVRRDKRTGPDGAEEPLAATAYKGGKRTTAWAWFYPVGFGIPRGRGGERKRATCSRASCTAFEQRTVAPAVRDCLALTSVAPGSSDASRGAASRSGTLSTL